MIWVTNLSFNIIGSFAVKILINRIMYKPYTFMDKFIANILNWKLFKHATFNSRIFAYSNSKSTKNTSYKKSKTNMTNISASTTICFVIRYFLYLLLVLMGRVGFCYHVSEHYVDIHPPKLSFLVSRVEYRLRQLKCWICIGQ